MDAERFRPSPPKTSARRRYVLGALAAALLGAPSASSGCAAPFDPASQVDSLRLFAVVADKPYASPGDTVRFEMTYYDGYEGPDGAGSRPVTVVWAAGCYNPVGDDYYGCYEQLAKTFEGLSVDVPDGGLPSPSDLPPGVQVGFGSLFDLKIPLDIVTSRPPPEDGPWYGLAIVFFLPCAGKLEPVPPESTGAAGSFPIGCFDAAGNRLGPESYVPGYTSVYVFDDGRTNANPVLQGLTLDGETLPDDSQTPAAAKSCPLTRDERRQSGCAAPMIDEECTGYEIEVTVPTDVAEVDRDATGPNGEQFREVVWVDYYADRGTFDGGTRLVSDAQEGYQAEHEVVWYPPPEPGTATLWAVLHDNRGGAAVIRRYVTVE